MTEKLRRVSHGHFRKIANIDHIRCLGALAGLESISYFTPLTPEQESDRAELKRKVEEYDKMANKAGQT